MLTIAQFSSSFVIKICSDKFDPAKEAYDWNPEDWKFVLDNLDLNLEARLGYIYQ